MLVHLGKENINRDTSDVEKSQTFEICGELIGESNVAFADGVDAEKSHFNVFLIKEKTMNTQLTFIRQ